ncbi:hypothetical protein PENSPDRAFT_653195 [Peniophora sp. CONT]|nr:hypothetical protein PENSPDRAFT_653195 [Peniophora sp. CONT]
MASSAITGHRRISWQVYLCVSVQLVSCHHDVRRDRVAVAFALFIGVCLGNQYTQYRLHNSHQVPEATPSVPQESAATGLLLTASILHSR